VVILFIIFKSSSNFNLLFLEIFTNLLSDTFALITDVYRKRQTENIANSFRNVSSYSLSDLSFSAIK